VLSAPGDILRDLNLIGEVAIMVETVEHSSLDSPGDEQAERINEPLGGLEQSPGLN
jgi:hypothetical protein